MGGAGLYFWRLCSRDMKNTGEIMERIPFDLQRALRGDELVDRKGRDVFGFKSREFKTECYPYTADTGFSYTSNGEYAFLEGYDADLFMKYPEHLEPRSDGSPKTVRFDENETKAISEALQKALEILQGLVKSPIEPLKHNVPIPTTTQPATPEMLAVVEAAIQIYKEGPQSNRILTLVEKVRAYLKSRESKS